ncbi:RsmF rRNA methyltransferase first C-terminal domain-containing protein [Butyrivibrio proteoclasticus]|uniref:RsmF rRNA methyltransferase first C-terminal domain-containing protein n=1 Tax=Butyrivibrio proteoclasticus TaxID=43305 RepID=UPI000478A529|nr:RsmF rRNA methyltransferase first C-terminal domain-containing protein [Butyrivibrio proteoclasticus]
MLPEQFKERMRQSLGDDEYNKFIESFDTDKRYHGLRFNALKSGHVKEIFSLTETIPWEPNGYYYEDDVAPGKHPYHEAGLYYIQEPSAMAPVHFLDPQPGDRTLDLCAAPGGKTTQIASGMKGQGILITNEINRDRSKILSLNVERMGIGNAMVLNEDSGHLAEVFSGYFTKILVDAPCSGEGMFRKNDNAADEWSPENVVNCAERQKEILDNAANMLLPGGRLVYSTCTFAPAENEEQILRFLFDHEDFHVKEIELTGGMENGRTDFISKELIDELSAISKDKLDKAMEGVKNTVRLWPHKVKGEGHFLCVLEREGELVTSAHGYVPGGRVREAKPEQVKPFKEFAKELNLTRELKGTYFMFGDQLYLAMPDMPSIAGLKVQRPGLHLGTIKKDRFEPSHALALFLNKSEVKNSYDISSDSQDIQSFLNGQTLRVEDRSLKGWTLVTCDGYSIGWCKASNGVLKNHYPKGLRINY